MRRLLSILSLIVLISSCTHKGFCVYHPHKAIVTVEFDWNNAPEADPKGMCVMFYPIDGGDHLRYDFTGTNGGQIEITAGRSKVLCYNNDTEAVLFKGQNDFESHTAYTREGNIFETIFGNGHSVPKKGSEEERVVICPDMMWGRCIEEVEIIEYTESVITLYPDELTSIYTYEIRNVKNLKHASQMCATLSGMSGSLCVSTRSLGSESVTLPFEASFDNESTIYGRFLTFGHNEENADPHRMNLYVWMDDGQKLLYGSDSEHFNVTDQIHDAPDKRRVHIVIDGLDLPMPIENGHGFKPSVDDWDIIEGDIIM